MVATLLAIFNTVLAALKAIPETSIIATEIAAIEAAVTGATTAYQAAQAKVDPGALQPITPE
jgi:hypothetical protein